MCVNVSVYTSVCTSARERVRLEELARKTLRLADERKQKTIDAAAAVIVESGRSDDVGRKSEKDLHRDSTQSAYCCRASRHKQ